MKQKAAPSNLSVSNPAPGHCGKSCAIPQHRVLWKRIADVPREEGVSPTGGLPRIASPKRAAAYLSEQRSSEFRVHHVGTRQWTEPNQNAGVGRYGGCRRSAVVRRIAPSLCSITSGEALPVHARPRAVSSPVELDSVLGLPPSQLHQLRHGGASHYLLWRRRNTLEGDGTRTVEVRDIRASLQAGLDKCRDWRPCSRQRHSTSASGSNSL